MTTHAENLKKDIDELQEEYERVTWANNLKVGDEVLVRYHSEWKEKNKVEEIYENYYVSPHLQFFRRIYCFTKMYVRIYRRRQ